MQSAPTHVILRGDWVQFPRDNRLMIGSVLAIRHGIITRDPKTVFTTAGAVVSKDIDEIRTTALDFKTAKLQPGDWIAFMQDGQYVIGIVVTIQTNGTPVTTLGIPYGPILEARRLGCVLS